jgi:hypothetical protein
MKIKDILTRVEKVILHLNLEMIKIKNAKAKLNLSSILNTSRSKESISPKL